MTERVGDKTMAVNFEYDINGRTTVINYPGGFGIKYAYDNVSGELTKIYTNKDSLIWELMDVNKHNQIKKYKYGNNLETILNYDSNNMIEDITTGTVQNISYSFDVDKGRFDYRNGMLTGIQEDFTYDDLNMDFNQLVSVTSTEKPELNISIAYDDAISGLIHSKSDIGTYQYIQERNAGPHAISGLTNVNANYNPEDQDSIKYTSFGKVSKIYQGNYIIEFTYGPDHQRKTMEVLQNNVLQRKVYYFGNYEHHEENGIIRHLYYIYSPNGLTAIYKKEDSNPGEMYYVHTDHLGSIHVITDDATTPVVQARYYYNPWGVQQNLDKAVGNTFQTTNDLPWLHCGFTGHEYITEIGLINMNGRVYDPDLGMFISPDPFIQAPDNPVNFNRYAYCYNNPLLYTDPSGNSAIFIPAVAIKAIGNLIWGEDHPIESAYDDVSEMFNEVSTHWQFEVYESENVVITAGIDPLNAGINANLYFRDEHTSGSISASAGLLNGFSLSASQKFTYKGWETGGSIGMGNNYKGWNANATWKGYGLGFGQTYYGEDVIYSDFDKEPKKQAVGAVNIFFNHNSVRLENDFLAFREEDRWRSNAVELSIGNFTIGTYIFNNDPKGEVDISDKYLHKNKAGEILGRWMDGQTYVSPLYFGIRQGNRTERIGYSNWKFQHYPQNWFAHEKGFARLGLFGYANYFMEYDHFDESIYYYSGYSNPFSIYGY